MTISTMRFAGAVLLSLALGCAPADNNGGGTGGGPAPGSGGSASGGATSSGGASASGGAPSSGGAVGSGGASSSGGAPGSGGSASGGSASGGASNTGGAPAPGGQGGSGSGSGGRGGSSATGGSASGGGGGTNTGAGGNSAGAAQPSTGCGKTNPQVGSGSSPLTVSGHQYYVKLPSSYDANKPYRAIFMFNPTGNPITWAEQNAGFESLPSKDNAIRIYPHPANSSNGWVASDVSFFRPLYDTITANFCVDKARVFAAGESSGGDFSSILGCEHANVLRSVGPCSTKDVPSYPLNATTRKCTGQVTPVVIHGKNDNVVGPANGPKTRDFYVALNHCSSTSTPVTGYTDTLSNCVQYQGCDVPYPVYWCNHTDPNYSGTNHGWPAFAAKFLWGLWSSY